MAANHRTHCWACSAKIRFPDAMVGRSAACPRCGTQVKLEPDAPVAAAATPAPSSARVFISHSTGDRELVERSLLKPFRDHGIGVWYAPEAIQTSEQWERSILDGLKQCDWFLVAMSPHAGQSEWVKDEVQWAVDERPRKMIPAMIAPCDPRQIHMRLARLQAIDFTRDPGAAMTKVSALLNHTSSKTQTPEDPTLLIESPARQSAVGRIVGEQFGPFVLGAKRPGPKAESRGQWFDARDVETNEQVLLEVWSAAGWDDVRLARFKRAMRAWTQLDHPHLVPIYAAGADPKTRCCYLAKDDKPYEPLDDLLKAGAALPWKQALAIAIDLARGLAYLHDKGMVHRDIQPCNIMLAGDTARLDASVLAKAAIDRNAPPRPEMEMTAKGAILGVPLYLPPEQARDARSVGPAADLYSLGGVLYHMLTGSTPYLGTNNLDLLIKHGTAPIPSARKTRPNANIPTALDSTVRVLLAKRPEDRFASAQETLDALLDVQRLS